MNWQKHLFLSINLALILLFLAGCCNSGSLFGRPSTLPKDVAQEAQEPEEAVTLVSPTTVPTNTSTATPTSTPTRTPAAASTHTMTPAATATHTTTPTSTSTRTPMPTSTLIPTPTCTYDMRFVADITIPDDMVVLPGEAFVKTWRILNAGGCPWPDGTSWIFARGSQMSGPSAVTVPATNPGQSVDVSVNLVAPGTPGTHTGFWTLRLPQGQTLSREYYVRIVVPSPTPIDTPESKPLVILMDRPPERADWPDMIVVNADSLADLPVGIWKEVTDPNWDRGRSIRDKDPDLVIIHRSAFHDEGGDNQERMKTFIGHMQNTRTMFLFYTRARIDEKDLKKSIAEYDFLEENPERWHVLPNAWGRYWKDNLKDKVKDILFP